MLLVSLLQRRGSVRKRMRRRLPWLVRIGVYAVLFFLILYFGVPASGRASSTVWA